MTVIYPDSFWSR